LTLNAGTDYTVSNTAPVAATIRNDDIIGNSSGNTLVGTALNEYLFGAAGNDTINGNAGNDRLDGGSDTDVLAGGTGRDTLLFRFFQSRLSAPDRITDLSIGSDKIDLLSTTSAWLASPSGFRRAGNSLAANLAALVASVFTDSNGRTAGNQPLGINRAALVVATAPAIAGTYLVVNDGGAGFQSSSDLVINISRYRGTLPALGPIPMNSWFV
jgi:Ca2+-binding RTX toxin-like protein